MYKVDLNSDLGESFGAYTIGSDDRVLALVSSANVACGFHAGDPSVMGATVAACRAQGVAVGAHPGFPDLVGFGRRQLAVTPDQAYGDVLYQIGALAGFCRTNGVLLQHVKPHGALYNMACKDLELARAVTRAVRILTRRWCCWHRRAPVCNRQRKSRACPLAARCLPTVLMRRTAACGIGASPAP